MMSAPSFGLAFTWVQDGMAYLPVATFHSGEVGKESCDTEMLQVSVNTQSCKVCTCMVLRMSADCAHTCDMYWREDDLIKDHLHAHKIMCRSVPLQDLAATGQRRWCSCAITLAATKATVAGL